MTQWTITKDLTDGCGEANQEGTVGPCSATLTASEIVSHPKAKDFRMYDDDGTLYYEGFLLGDDEFAPLDDFGEPNAGCTRIDVLENGKWVIV
jgi:hypothetical protein